MKTLSVLLSILVLFSMVPALAEEGSVDYLGDWELTEMTIMETPVKPADLEISMVMTIREDGTVLLVSMHGEHEEQEEGTWVIGEEGLVITFNDEEGLYVLTDDGSLIFEDTGEGGRMVYRRVEAA